MHEMLKLAMMQETSLHLKMFMSNHVRHNTLDTCKYWNLYYHKKMYIMEVYATLLQKFSVSWSFTILASYICE